MATKKTSFYTSGGTLAVDAPSYITRAADDDIYEGLREGRFCYVLTSRQMGKSSLRNRTAKRLRDEGTAVAELDLTGIGRNLTAEQWYDGIVYELGRELGLKTQLNACWEQNIHLGPLHRLMCVLLEGVLKQIPGNVVIFIDEIEVVRSLTFSTDEFFAAIRACYNLRGSAESMQRLSFCLLGMAAPADLIQDTRITPFNIGRRIDLMDFTTGEVGVLASGLTLDGRDGEMLLERVLYWTGGHPYLTQRVCQAAAENPEVTTALEVDMIVADLFLSTRARESDANLVPVREYLLRNSEDVAGTLDLYNRVRAGQRVQYDETDPLIRTLNLAGITRVEDGRLHVRNRIYAHVFDQKWVAVNMPDAEAKRQKAAYRKGQLRATAIASVIIAIMGGLVWAAVQERNRADAKEQETKHIVYDSDMISAQAAINSHDVALALRLLGDHKQDRWRDFEYGYLWQLCHQVLFTANEDASTVYAVAFSPDSKLLAAATYKGSVVVRDSQTGGFVRQFTDKGAVHTLAFSPNGKWLAFAGERKASIVATATWKEIPTRFGSVKSIRTIAFAADSKLLAAAAGDTCTIWNIADWKPRMKVGEQNRPIYSVAFSQDGRTLATGGPVNANERMTGEVSLWDVSRDTALPRRLKFDVPISSIAFSPDGKWLAVGGSDRFVKIIDTSSFQHMHPIDAKTRAVRSISFSPDSRQLALACDDRTIKLFSVLTAENAAVLAGHTSTVNCVAFSRNGKWLASGGWDNTARIWDAAKAISDRVVLQGYDRTTCSWIYSRDGTRLETTNDNDETQVWNTATGKKIGKKLPYDDKVNIVARAFTADNRTLALATDQNTIQFYDPVAGKMTNTLKVPFKIAGALEFSNDGIWIAAGVQERDGQGIQNYVQVWRFDNAGPARKYPVSALVKSIGLSASGEWMAAGFEDHSVTVWKRTAPQAQFQLDGHAQRLTTVVFSPDGHRLVTGSEDNTPNSNKVILWDLDTKREALAWVDDRVTDVSYHSEGPAAAFSHSGDELVTIEGREFARWRSTPVPK